MLFQKSPAGVLKGCTVLLAWPDKIYINEGMCKGDRLESYCHVARIWSPPLNLEDIHFLSWFIRQSRKLIWSQPLHSCAIIRIMVNQSTFFDQDLILVESMYHGKLVGFADYIDAVELRACAGSANSSQLSLMPILLLSPQIIPNQREAPGVDIISPSVEVDSMRCGRWEHGGRLLQSLEANPIIRERIMMDGRINSHRRGVRCVVSGPLHQRRHISHTPMRDSHRPRIEPRWGCASGQTGQAFNWSIIHESWTVEQSTSFPVYSTVQNQGFANWSICVCIIRTVCEVLLKEVTVTNHSLTPVPGCRWARER